jgi:hypothetical protein
MKSITVFSSKGLELSRKVLYDLSHAPALFALVIFGIGSHVYIWAGMDHDPIYPAFYWLR